MHSQARHRTRSKATSAGDEVVYAGNLVIDGLRTMLQHADGVRRADFDAVHDMRVASRRLRAVLGVFGHDFSDHAGEDLDRHVKGVTRALGAARDLDVQIERLRHLRDTLRNDLREGLDALVAEKRAQRLKLDSAVLKAIDKTCARDLAAEFSRRAGLASRAARTSPNGSSGKLSLEGDAVVVDITAMKSRAAAMIADRVAALVRWAPAVEDPRREDELHCMRIEAKRLRYTLEIFLPFVGDPAMSAIAEVKSLQTLLGDIHDADVLLPDLIEATAQCLHRYSKSRAVLDSASGLFSAAQSLRAYRTDRYHEFIAEWHRLRDATFFDRLLTDLGANPAAGNKSAAPRGRAKTARVTTKLQAAVPAAVNLKESAPSPAKAPVRKPRGPRPMLGSSEAGTNGPQRPTAPKPPAARRRTVRPAAN